VNLVAIAVIALGVDIQVMVKGATEDIFIVCKKTRAKKARICDLG
jgi:hypothetical protein